jgi:hypothetical protein
MPNISTGIARLCYVFGRDLSWNQVWWFTSVIPALGRQEDSEFKANLGYTARP